jgi:hemerythrin superfamily protein
MTEARDGLELLVTDHREVESMFGQLEAESATATLGDDQLQARKQLVNRVTQELMRHAAAEEEYLYPLMRKVLPTGAEQVDHELAEHGEAEKLMNQLDKESAGTVEFEDNLRQLMSVIRDHIQDEEGRSFPDLRARLSEQDLQQLGEKLASAKKVAPTRPHPAAPDTPPLNKVMNPVAGIVDRARDAVTGRGESESSR